MKLTKSSSKNSTTYYVQKSYRIGNKTSTKTVERLGSIEELKTRAGDKDPIEWAKEYIKNLPFLKKNLRKISPLSTPEAGRLIKMSGNLLMWAIFS